MKINRLIILLLFFIYCDIGAFAAIDIDSVSLMQEDRNLNVVCKANNNQVPLGFFVYEKDDESKIAAFGQKDYQDGAYNFNAKLGENFEGRTLVLRISSVLDGIVTSEIHLASQQEVGDLLSVINNAESQEILGQKIDYYMQIVPIICNVKLVDLNSYRNEALRILYLSKDEIHSYFDVIDYINKSIAVAMLNSIDQNNFKNILADPRYGTAIVAQIYDYTTDAQLQTETNRLLALYRQDKSLASLLSTTGANFDNASQAKQAIEEAIAVAAVNMSKASGLSDVFFKYSDLFNKVDSNFKETLNGDYKTLGATMINKAFVDVTFNNANEITEKLHSVISKLKSTQNSGNGSGGSGNGGGSSSSRAQEVYYDNSVKNDDTEKAAFSDLEDAVWAKIAIETLKKYNIIDGTGDGRFDVNRPVMREEFVKMFVLVSDILNDKIDCNFSDVKKEDWYYKYIASAVKHGFVNGLDENNFGSGLPITREDMTCILYRLLLSKDISLKDDETVKFNDENNISDYAKKAVSAMKYTGIINGFNDGRFCPKEYVTRAQSAEMVYRVFNILNNK